VENFQKRKSEIKRRPAQKFGVTASTLTHSSAKNPNQEHQVFLPLTARPKRSIFREGRSRYSYRLAWQLAARNQGNCASGPLTKRAIRGIDDGDSESARAVLLSHA
jgi:hypothetical protein